MLFMYVMNMSVQLSANLPLINIITYQNQFKINSWYSQSGISVIVNKRIFIFTYKRTKSRQNSSKSDLKK